MKMYNVYYFAYFVSSPIHLCLYHSSVLLAQTEYENVVRNRELVAAGGPKGPGLGSVPGVPPPSSSSQPPPPSAAAAAGKTGK